VYPTSAADPVQPGHEPFGNTTETKTKYRQTAPATLEAIGRLAGMRTAKQVFQQLDDECPGACGPRNLSKIHSKMSAVRCQHNGSQAVNTTNIADGTINVPSMLHMVDFVQCVFATKM
jgi:hypothetical protein